MNPKVITTIGVGLAFLVGGWAYYSVLSTMPASAPAAPLPPTTGSALNNNLATIAAHQNLTQQLLNGVDPNDPLAPAIDPNLPLAPATPAVDPTSVNPATNPGAPIMPPMTRQPVPVEQWDYSFRQKPLSPDVQ